jgi:hypothetical protein
MAATASGPRILVGGVMVALLIIAVSAIPRGVADVYGYFVQAHLDTWAERRQLPKEQEWQQVRELVRSALDWTPEDPRLLQQAGRLYEWGALIGEAREERSDQAFRYYRASLSRRPTWPYAWADLAAAKARFGQIDAEFQRAFARALETGPWEPEVQLNIARAGFLAFRQLDRANRAALARTIQNMSSRQLPELVRIARETGSLWIVCAIRGDQPEVQRACR